MNKKVFVEYYIGKDAPTVARRLRRHGFEARVSEKQWVVVYSIGEYQTALDEIRTTMRAVSPRAVDCDWGVADN